MAMDNQVLEKAREMINSPFFLYDIDGLDAHLQNMTANLPTGIKLWYACKANPLSDVIKTVYKNGINIDVASAGEYAQAIACKAKQERILVTGPAKSSEYLEKLLLEGVNTFVLESPNQLVWLNEVASKHDKKPTGLLRVQLDWEGEGSSVLGGNKITPFGVDSSEWQKVNLDQYKNVFVRGIHVFQWGNIHELSKLQGIWQKISDEAKDLAKELDFNLEILDLGGGLGIPYNQDTPRLDWNSVTMLLSDLKDKTGINEIWMELGRYIIGEYGKYLCQVVDVKTVRGRNIIVLNSGINHLIRPALTGEPFPCTSLIPTSAKKKEYYLHGPLCTALDRMGNADLPIDIRPGDWLVFSQAGAYGFTESMPYFLCHELAAELSYIDKEIKILRPPEQATHWMV